MTQAPPTLEYQRLERARRTAVGGLRLIGFLTALLSISIFVLFDLRFFSRPPRGISPMLMKDLAILATTFVLGVTKFVCALLIDRRSRAAAVLALGVISLETFVLLALLYRFYNLLVNDTLEGLPARATRFTMTAIAILGWIGVAYEIVHLLRHPKPVDDWGRAR